MNRDTREQLIYFIFIILFFTIGWVAFFVGNRYMDQRCIDSGGQIISKPGEYKYCLSVDEG